MTVVIVAGIVAGNADSAAGARWCVVDAGSDVVVQRTMLKLRVDVQVKVSMWRLPHFP